MPNLINPERGYIVTANNHIIDDKYIHRLNGGFMIDSRSKAIENAIQFYIDNRIKIDEKIVMEKLLNIIDDPFCIELLSAVFKTVENSSEYEKLIRSSSQADIIKSKDILNNFNYKKKLNGNFNYSFYLISYIFILYLILSIINFKRKSFK
jgi:hypothetical protein